MAYLSDRLRGSGLASPSAREAAEKRAAELVLQWREKAFRVENDLISIIATELLRSERGVWERAIEMLMAHVNHGEYRHTDSCFDNLKEQLESARDEAPVEGAKPKEEIS